MRPLAFTLALTSLTLTACDSSAFPPPPESDRQAVVKIVEVPAPPPEASFPPEPAGPVPKVADIAIVESGGRAPRRIEEDRLMPLSKILEIAERRVPGQIIEVELDDDDDDGPEYELEILTADGRSIEMKIDARRGTILKVEED